ncbi:MinD/ParA family ATP-binding protein [Natronobacterium texcoconense]|uniref:Septum site-determining protein MinD n=1 Tax=Natronobacterium texcoconense TaxID=1095778 RepID=A0A1H0YTN2_NATTX|nr:P-loop NTPase [Natronobacterium texcoconense]SDQ18582.1 septum site-determining protein MinD [Natronobacterium texcoconense]
MIVAVGGGKGGVGKTTVAVNLARELGAVVVDGDLATGDVPKGDGPLLQDVLAGRVRPVAAVDDRDPIRMLSSGRTLAAARSSDLSALPAVLRSLEREFGRVVVDCPAGIARDVGYQLYSATIAVLVTTPDRAALADAIRTRDLASDLETPVGLVVLNHVSRDGAIETTVDRIEETLGVSVSTLETRSTIAESFECGQPVRDAFPSSPAVDSFAEIARRIDAIEERGTSLR